MQIVISVRTRRISNSEELGEEFVLSYSFLKACCRGRRLAARWAWPFEVRRRARRMQVATFV